MIRIESLLSARLFLAPQLVGERLFFISNMSGRLSLYVMNNGGSVPEPLLPPDIALQNPELLGGKAFAVFPELDIILVIIDRDGDEHYQPMVIPINGGFPEPAFGNQLADYRVVCPTCDTERGIVYFGAESLSAQTNVAFRGDLRTRTLEKLGESRWGAFVFDANSDHTQVILADGYTMGDVILYRWQQGQGERTLLYGTPLEARPEDAPAHVTGIGACRFTPDSSGLLCINALVEDTYGLGYLSLSSPSEIRPVPINGIHHDGIGELTGLEALGGDRYLVQYNIDGCSWAYTGRFDQAALVMHVEQVICGAAPLANGVLESITYDKQGKRFAMAFSTATSPTQLYTVASDASAAPVAHTNERVLGIAPEWLSPGEDASFTSFDGLRISARLYLPAPALGFDGPRPLVYYIHGGPQGQERPDFAWFSMPLIQFLTMNGFAVFVPNARGSTGYGLSYTKQVDHDWGGQDRLDHVHAMGLLARDTRVDARRAGVVGRSYGGYMTLTLAARHPELWAAAVDMFGPYNLLTFTERIPEAWKPYFAIAIGDPVKDRDFLVERSPQSYIDNIACPLLVIQGKNDPRVIERESRDVVEQLQANGKQVEYLMFENEGHDVLKLENRVTCYNTITEFFSKHL